MNALIVDGEELYRLSMREVISVAGNFTEIFEACSEQEFIAQAAKHNDLSLIVLHPGTLSNDQNNCFTLVRRLFPKAAILTITNKANDFKHQTSPNQNIMSADRGSSVIEMVKAIRGVLNMPTDGFGAVSERPAAPAVRTIVKGHGIYEQELNKAADLSRLSYRQKQILAMAADGLPNKEIAARLSIAEGTVKAHMHAIFKVMGVSNRTQAVIKYGAAGQNLSPNSQEATQNKGDDHPRRGAHAYSTWASAAAF